MARTVQPSTWVHGFKESAVGISNPWAQWPGSDDHDDDRETLGYVPPPAKEIVTSIAHNSLGVNVLRTWPTLYDGTNSPHGTPSWWNPSKEVDVVICGAGPSGLQVAVSLARQGISFRIIDKADGPLIAGRADGVQPRFLEILHTWGLAQEVHEEGPLIERTAIYKDGKKLFFDRSHQSDSRYRGLHIITQGQIERIYIRDLLRHRSVVERSTVLDAYSNEGGTYPLRMKLRNNKTGRSETIRAKFLVGSDGAASSIRKELSIPFDGMSTNIYWGIMDCVFKSDYPHAWVFGSVISSEHGGCVIIPREDGYIRLYTQLDISRTGVIAASRHDRNKSIEESGGQLDINSITPEEVLAQANRIFAPYKLSFAAPLSWFAIWKISERVARHFSSPDLRVHLVGDAAHVHSVMGAFGLNASIMDASNLAWKLGMVSSGKAKMEEVLSTYDKERRDQAVRIIETSGEYLRFVCNTDLTIANVRDVSKMPDKETVSTESNGTHTSAEKKSKVDSVQSPANSEPSGQNGINGHASSNGNGATDSTAKDLEFLGGFFQRNGKFLLGLDAPFPESVLSTSVPSASSGASRPVSVLNGVRAPNPRVCFSASKTGYLYDAMTGAATFHIVLFCSTLHPRIVSDLAKLTGDVLGDERSFYHRYGGRQRFNIILVTKAFPDEFDAAVSASKELEELQANATVLLDDRAPDEDAHTTWGVDHTRGAAVVVRPDLWVSTAVALDESKSLGEFFDGFMIEQDG